MHPTLGGRIGSSVYVNKDAGQVQWDLVSALKEKGFSLNDQMISLYDTDDMTKSYGRKDGHSLTPSFGKSY